MRRTCYCIVAVALLWGLLFAADAGRAGPAPGAGRQESVDVYSYDKLVGWVFSRVPEVKTRPAHVILVFDRTDTINGLDGQNRNQKGVLSEVWSRDLLGTVLQYFLVEANEGAPDGDRISILGWGRGAIEEVVTAQPFKRTKMAEWRSQYPKPYTNTPPSEWDDNLDRALSLTTKYASRNGQKENILILLMTDDIVEGSGARTPAQAKGFRPYIARGSSGERPFTVYLYANDFPNQTEFRRWDAPALADTQDTRDFRARAQEQRGCPDPETEAYQNLGTGEVVRSGEAKRAHEKYVHDLGIGLGIAALLLLGMGLVLADWRSAHYKVVEGGIYKTVWVKPRNRQRELPVTNPQVPGERIGVLRVSGPGILGMHRLVLCPSSQYVLHDARGVEAQREGGKASSLTLVAGSGRLASNLIRFAGRSTATETAAGQGSPAPDRGSLLLAEGAAASAGLAPSQAAAPASDGYAQADSLLLGDIANASQEGVRAPVSTDPRRGQVDLAVQRRPFLGLGGRPRKGGELQPGAAP